MSSTNPPRESRAWAAALLFPAGALALIFAARRLEFWPAFPCRFFDWTQLPCPGCGVTRCLGALARGHFREALYWNPLGFFLVGAAFFQPLAWRHRVARDGLKGRSARWLLAALVAANWFYLFLALPRSR